MKWGRTTLFLIPLLVSKIAYGADSEAIRQTIEIALKDYSYTVQLLSSSLFANKVIEMGMGGVLGLTGIGYFGALAKVVPQAYGEMRKLATRTIMSVASFATNFAGAKLALASKGVGGITKGAGTATKALEGATKTGTTITNISPTARSLQVDMLTNSGAVALGRTTSVSSVVEGSIGSSQIKSLTTDAGKFAKTDEGWVKVTSPDGSPLLEPKKVSDDAMKDILSSSKEVRAEYADGTSAQLARADDKGTLKEVLGANELSSLTDSDLRFGQEKPLINIDANKVSPDQATQILNNLPKHAESHVIIRAGTGAVRLIKTKDGKFQIDEKYGVGGKLDTRIKESIAKTNGIDEKLFQKLSTNVHAQVDPRVNFRKWNETPQPKSDYRTWDKDKPMGRKYAV